MQVWDMRRDKKENILIGYLLYYFKSIFYHYKVNSWNTKISGLNDHLYFEFIPMITTQKAVSLLSEGYLHLWWCMYVP